VYGEVVRVPLILSAPGRLPAGDRVTHLSRHLDLAPTLLSLLGVPSPPSFHGKSVLRPARRALLETAKWQGVYRGQWHLVRSPVLGRELLFDHDDELDREPLENSEVLPALHAEVDEYVAMLRDAATAPARRAEPARAWSREEVERLRALGYAD